MRGSKVAGSAQHYSSVEDEVTYLSTQQIWDTLVHLLWLTLRPLANQTDVTLDILFVILGSTTDKRRKLSVLESDECLDYTYRLLFHPPETALKASLAVLGTERTIYQWFIDSYLTGVYQPRTWAGIQDGLHYSDEALFSYTKDFYDLYSEFRSKTAKRFIKLSASLAAKNHWSRSQFGLVSDLKDNEHNYFLATLKGIDRLYPGEGTLAKYMMPWLTNAAGSQYTMYVGEAFNLSRPVRKAIHDGTLNVNNKSFDLDHAVEVPDESVTYISSSDVTDLSRQFGQLMRSPDISLVMLLNGFPQLFPDSIWERVSQLVADPLPETWKPPVVELEDFPTLETLSRATRKDSPEQRRRKEAISSRRKPQKNKGEA